MALVWTHLHTPILIPEDINPIVADEVAAVSRPQTHSVNGVLLLGHLLLLEDLLLCRLVLRSQEAISVSKTQSSTYYFRVRANFAFARPAVPPIFVNFHSLIFLTFRLMKSDHQDYFIVLLQILDSSVFNA